MRGFALGLSLSIAFILGCVAAPLVVPPLRAQNEPPPAAVARWEYQCLPVSMATLEAIERAQVQFNRLGAQGWELVVADSQSVLACFKRPL